MISIYCAGVDPKSIVCEYFRNGQCTKGFKCKFSHDLNVERKGGKIDIFQDRCWRLAVSILFCRSTSRECETCSEATEHAIITAACMHV